MLPRSRRYRITLIKSATVRFCTDGDTIAGDGMAILIDTPRWMFRGRLWSHMISDGSIAELHDFARTNFIRYMSFGLDHYDIPESLLAEMIAAGAVKADSRELVRRLRVAGLRRPEGKEARAWRHASLVGDHGGLVIEPEVLTEATRALTGQQPHGDVGALARCYARPNTTVVVVEGDRDPGQNWPDQTVVSRYGQLWALEFVIGDF